MAYAVVIKKCNPDSFELTNSYPAEPIIRIPKLRKTYFQHHIQANAVRDFGLSNMEVKTKFNSHSGMNIEWNTLDNDWLLMDEGYGLQFRLKNSLQNQLNGLTIE